MDDKSFRNMDLYKQNLKMDNDQKLKKYKVKEEKEPKSAIWWMIMIFCIVYGVQIVYHNILTNGGL